jgi:WD40 repeat protein
MTNRSMRESARSGSSRPLRIVLATLAIVGLGWAGIGLDPANLNLDGWRWIVEADSPQPRLVRVFAHDGDVGDVACSPDGQRIAAGGQLHNALMIWDARTGALLHRFDREVGSISAVAWSPDGKYVAAGRWFTEVTRGHIALSIWDATSGRRLHSLVGPLPLGQGLNNVASRSLSFSPDSKVLAAGHRGAISLHDVATGRLKLVVRGDRSIGRVLGFDPGGRLIATAGSERGAPIRLYDVETGEHVKSLGADRQSPFALAYNPNGTGIATSDYGKPIITLWDVESGRPVRDLTGHTAPLRALVYSSDGKLLASAASGGGVIVWDSAGGGRLASLPAPSDLTESLCFSPDARYLAVAVGRQVRVWDLAQVLPSRP